MTKNKFLQILIICLTLTSCKSCEDEVWTTLPPETQKGANTFGCYVNGELMVPRKNVMFSQRSLTATYEEQRLYINCESKDDAGKAHLNLIIHKPKENEYNTLEIANLYSSNRRDCHEFGCSDCDKIFITKFDTINHIVSGTFEFSGACISSYIYNEELGYSTPVYSTDSTIYITEGRFDIEFTSF